MAQQREEISYVFTGDTSSLSSETTKAIGLLDEVQTKIKDVADSTKASYRLSPVNTSSFKNSSKLLGDVQAKIQGIVAQSKEAVKTPPVSTASLGSTTKLYDEIAAKIRDVTAQSKEAVKTAPFQVKDSGNTSKILDDYKTKLEQIKNSAKSAATASNTFTAKLPEQLNNASQSASRLGKFMNFSQGIYQSNSAINNLVARVAQLRSAFDPVTRAMQSMKSTASSTFPGITKLCGTASSAFRRVSTTAKESAGSFIKDGSAVNLLKKSLSGMSSVLKSTKNLFDQLTKSSNKLGSSFSSLKPKGFGLKSMFIGLTGVAIGKFFKTAISEAIGYVETLNQFNVVMGESKEVATEFVNKIQDMYGLDPRTIMSMTSQFYQLASAIEMPVESARTLSMGLTNTALNLSSLFDTDFNKVAEDLSAGMQGMTRSVRKYGIDLRQATLESTAATYGLKINAATTSEANRQALRYITIVRQARAASGDFANTLESPANQLRVLKEQFTQLARSIGSFFLPVLKKVLPVLNGIIMALVSIINFIRSIFKLDKIEFSSATDSAQDLGSSMDDAGGAIDDTTKKAKKMRKELTAPFDELNIFKEDKPDSDSGSGSGAGGGGGSGTLDPKLADAIADISNELTEVRTKANDVRDAILSFLGFSWDKEGKLTFDASQLQNNLINKFPSWTQTINAFFSNWQGIANGFKNVWSALGGAIKAVFQGIVDGFTKMIQGMNLDATMADWIEQLPEKLNNLATWITEHEEMFNTFGQIISGVATAFTTWKIISTILQPFMSIVSIITALGPAGMLLVGTIALIVAGFVNAWKKSERFRTAVGELKTSFGNMVESLTTMWNHFWEMFKPILDKIVKAITDTWNNHIAPLVTKVGTLIADIIDLAAEIITWIIDIFGPGLKAKLSVIIDIVKIAIDSIIDIIDAIVDIVDGVVQVVSGIMKGDWKRVWDGAKKILRGVLNGILTILGGMVNAAISGINWMIAKITGGISKVVNTVLKPLNAVLKAVGVGEIKPVDFSYQIPMWKVPKLAKGGVVTDATMAMVGEGKYPEAILPLGNSPQLAELVDRIAEAVGTTQDDDTPLSVTVNLDSQVLFKSTQRASKKRGVDFKMGAFAR